MRENYSKAFKSFFNQNLISTRKALGLTQEDMADILAMAARTYVDLDHGKTSCSGLTLALYLAKVCEDPMKFLEEFRALITMCDEKIA